MVELPKPTITCGITSVPVLVLAHYKGGIVPIQGASVTLKLGAFYPGGQMTIIPIGLTDINGMAQTCISVLRYNEAWIQKGDVDFGSGMGVMHKIGSGSGGAGSYTYSKDSLTPQPCTPPQVYNPVTGRCESPIPTCSPPQVYNPVTGRCESPIPTCTPPQVYNPVTRRCESPIPTCSPPQVYNPVTGRCESPIPTCTPPQVYNPLTRRCEKIIPTCSPPQVYNPVTGRCESPIPTCSPPQVYNPVTGRCESPIPTCTPPQVYNPVTRRCESPIPTCTPPQVYNPVTGRCESPIPTCSPPQVYNPVTGRCESPELGKQIKILTYPEGAPLEAYEGQEVTISASVTCGLSLSNAESVILLVDGKEAARGTTSQGIVSLKWIATTDPSRTHKICISVPKSDQCYSYGEARDCKTITVSRIIPGIEEQLRKERAAYQSQLESLRSERERIRELTTIPITTKVPADQQIISIPTLGQTITASPIPSSETGIISIPSVKTPPGIVFPIEIYIDGQLIGSPPIYRQVSPGTHTVRIQLKGFSPISLKIDVPGGGIKTIEESFI